MRSCVSFRGRRSGQAMLESIIVLIVLLAGFLLYFDFTYGIVTRLLLNNAVARAARADTVGFNDFHRTKSYRIGMIPVSGKRERPEPERGVRGMAMELAFAQAYLRSETPAEARGLLHYERWPNLSHHITRSNDLITVKGEFHIPKQYSRRLGEMIGILPKTLDSHVTAEWAMEDHASLYLRN